MFWAMAKVEPSSFAVATFKPVLTAFSVTCSWASLSFRYWSATSAPWLVLTLSIGGYSTASLSRRVVLAHRGAQCLGLPFRNARASRVSAGELGKQRLFAQRKLNSLHKRAGRKCRAEEAMRKNARGKMRNSSAQLTQKLSWPATGGHPARADEITSEFGRRASADAAQHHLGGPQSRAMTANCDF